MVLSRAASIPTVIVPAGGYGPNAYRYTARTLAWLLSGEDLPIPTEEEAALKSFRAIRRSLESQSLHADPSDDADPFKLTEADIYGDLYHKTPDRRFLGFYSSFGLEIAFERYGLADHLRRRGYPHFVIDGDLVIKRGEQGARVYGDDTRHDLLIELTLSERVVEGSARLMSIEWLTLQDPKRKPSGPLLPGQKHPGLGCLEIIVGMLIMACESLGYDGLTLVPSHFHVASQARRLFSFWEPKDEAHFLALSRATHHLPLFDASLAIAHGFVVHKASGEPQHYHPARMVRPVSAQLKSRATDPAYARAVEEASRDLDFELRCQPSA